MGNLPAANIDSPPFGEIIKAMIVVAIPMMAPCDKWWMMSQGSITTELVAETAESWRELLIVAVKL